MKGQRFGNVFMRGLFTIAPITLTVAILIWLVNIFETTIGALVHRLIPNYYFPGLGILLTFTFIFIIGALVNTLFMQKMVNGWEKLFHKIPLIKTLYQSIADMLNFFQTDDSTQIQKVCVVTVNGFRFLGLVTRDDLKGLPTGMGSGEEDVVVFLPMSYQIGGFAMVVKRKDIQPIAMSVEDAMRFLITAGAVAKKK